MFFVSSRNENVATLREAVKQTTLSVSAIEMHALAQKAWEDAVQRLGKKKVVNFGSSLEGLNSGFIDLYRIWEVLVALTRPVHPHCDEFMEI